MGEVIIFRVRPTLRARLLAEAERLSVTPSELARLIIARALAPTVTTEIASHDDQAAQQQAA